MEGKSRECDDQLPASSPGISGDDTADQTSQPDGHVNIMVIDNTNANSVQNEDSEQTSGTDVQVNNQIDRNDTEFENNELIESTSENPEHDNLPKDTDSTTELVQSSNSNQLIDCVSVSGGTCGDCKENGNNDKEHNIHENIEEQDVLALSEEECTPSFVITNVCSLKDDDTFFEGEFKEVDKYDNQSEGETHSILCSDNSTNVVIEPQNHLSEAQKVVELGKFNEKQTVFPHENDASENVYSPAVNASVSDIHQTKGSSQESGADCTILNPDNANKRCFSSQSPERNTSSVSVECADEVQNNGNQESLYENEAEAQSEQIIEEEISSSSSATQFEYNLKQKDPESPVSFVVKLEAADDGYGIGSAGPRVKIISTETGVMSGSGEAVKFKRKRSSTEIGGTQEIDNSVSSAKRQMTEVDTIRQSSLMYNTFSKPLVIPSNLMTKKGTESHSLSTKSVAISIPPALQGPKLKQHILSLLVNRPVSDSAELQPDHANTSEGDAIDPGLKKMRKRFVVALSQAQQKPGSSSSLSSLVGSAQRISTTCNPQPFQKAAITTPLLGSTTATKSLAQNNHPQVPAVQTSKACSQLFTVNISQDDNGRSRVNISKNQVFPQTACSSSVISRSAASNPISNPVVCSNPSILRSELNTRTQAPLQVVSSHPSLTAGTSSSTLLVSQLTSHSQVPILVKSLQTPASSTSKKNRLPPTSLSSSTLQNILSCVQSQAPASVTAPLSTHQAMSEPVTKLATLRQKQDVRLDQVSSEAKLSATDMAALIQGKNLVQSLEPKRRPGSSVYRCVECGVVCSTVLGYTAHVKRMSMVIRYACMLCKAALVFFNKCTFLAHLRKHTTTDASNGQVLNLKSYTMSVSSLPIELLQPVELQFTDPLTIYRNQPVRCSECHETFSDAFQLALHFSASVLYCNFQHPCPHCKMELATVCALKAHLRLHDPHTHMICASENFICPDCGQRFHNQLSLYQHLYATCLHFNRLAILTCPFCKALLPSWQSLEEHIYLIHQNKKRYKCNLCSRTYSSRSFFDQHIIQLHREDANNLTFKVVPSCGKCINDKTLLEGRDHARKHAQQEMAKSYFGYVCFLCKDVIHVSRHEFLRHLNKVHAAFKFPCSICERGFISHCLLRAHVLSSHGPKDKSQNEEATFKCCTCSLTSLNSESALPHVMWHITKKLAEPVESAKSPSTQSLLKHSMEIVVPEDTNTSMAFCRICGHTFHSQKDKDKHIHMVCKKFPSCPRCQRFDFVNELIYSHHVNECKKTTDNAHQIDRSRSQDANNCMDGDASSETDRQQKQDTEETSSNACHSATARKSSAQRSRSNIAVDTEGIRTKTIKIAYSSAPKATDQQSVETSPLSKSCGQTPRKEMGQATKLNNPQAKTVLVFSKGGNIIGCKEKPDGKNVPGFLKRTNTVNTERPAKMYHLKRKVIKVIQPKGNAPTIPAGSINSNSCLVLAQEKHGVHSSPGKTLHFKIMNVPPKKERRLSSSDAKSGDQDSAALSLDQIGGRDEEDQASVPCAMETDELECETERLHVCQLCGLTYASAHQLSNHRTSVHGGRKTVMSCEVCEKRGKKVQLSRKNLKKHLVRRHNLLMSLAESMVSEKESGLHAVSEASTSENPKAGVSNSESCAEFSICTNPVKRLRIADGDQQEYTCAKCDFSSLSMEDFHQHITIHMADNSVQCLECGLCFSAMASLKKHLFLVHKVKQPAVYIAQHDIKLEELPTDLSSHIDTFAPLGQPEVVIGTADVFHENLYKSTTTTQSQSEEREKKQTDSSLFECNVCYKGFASEIALKSHMRNHGMAFIKSRRANSRETSKEKSPNSNDNTCTERLL